MPLFAHLSTGSLSWVRGQDESGEITLIMPTVLFSVAKHNVDELDRYIQHGVASLISQ